jgi:hypothetical protein
MTMPLKTIGHRAVERRAHSMGRSIGVTLEQRAQLRETIGGGDLGAVVIAMLDALELAESECGSQAIERSQNLEAAMYWKDRALQLEGELAAARATPPPALTDDEMTSLRALVAELRKTWLKDESRLAFRALLRITDGDS